VTISDGDIDPTVDAARTPLQIVAIAKDLVTRL